MGAPFLPFLRTQGGRRLLPALLALLPLLAACASTDPDAGRTWQPADESSWATTARALAADLGATLVAEPGTRTLVIEGRGGRILFLDGTRMVTVDGQRLEASTTLQFGDGDVALANEDAVRISQAWKEAVSRREARERALAAAAAPAPPSRAPPRGDAVGDPEWNVPLKREWEGILIHHSATEGGNLAKFDKFHREVNGWLMVGYDFIICNGDGGPDGLVQTSERWTTQIQGAHAGKGLKRYNDHWVGICLVGDFSRERPTAKQMASLRRLVRYLQDRCGIPDANVRTHRDVRDTDCPGKHFPLGEVLRAGAGPRGAEALRSGAGLRASPRGK
ncbi:MAG: N-acetylmuramoyl-L-alanine amidase [Planctomycetaceae bacterium]|nr:N-acetylmuramoyl-L-alanine amidase [Planctomycetaceae bacterium]